MGKPHEDVESWRECRTICLEVPVCDKFVYFVKGKNCYIKSGGDGGSKKNGVISGLHGCKMENLPSLTGKCLAGRRGSF